jgi:hypothetical protein
VPEIRCIFWTIRCTRTSEGKFRGKNSDATLDHKTQGNISHYFPGKKACLMVLKTQCLL